MVLHRQPGHNEDVATESNRVKFTLEIDREEDGRFIAEVLEIPGALAYGATESQAIANVQALAFRVLAERLEHGEQPDPFAGFDFVSAA